MGNVPLACGVCSNSRWPTSELYQCRSLWGTIIDYSHDGLVFVAHLPYFPSSGVSEPLYSVSNPFHVIGLGLTTPLCCCHTSGQLTETKIIQTLPELFSRKEGWLSAGECVWRCSIGPHACLWESLSKNCGEPCKSGGLRSSSTLGKFPVAWTNKCTPAIYLYFSFFVVAKSNLSWVSATSKQDSWWI